MTVDVLIDRAAGNLSITTADDTTKAEVETTLSVEEAWALVGALNSAIQKLNPGVLPVSKQRHRRQSQQVPTPAISNTRVPVSAPRMREAVLFSVDSPRYKPGS